MPHSNMPARPRKDPLQQKRRTRNPLNKDEHYDDSQSDQSLPSDADDDADADYSDLSDPDANDNSDTEIPPKQTTQQADTDLMRNGGGDMPKEAPKSEPLQFDQSTTAAAAQQDSDKKLKPHEEYKRRLESDPAFIPNRGAFFMHDSRHDKSARGGRGRGRGGAQAG
jgi:hypothetical protein